jgi:hypothetical protein
MTPLVNLQTQASMLIANHRSLHVATQTFNFESFHCNQELSKT